MTAATMAHTRSAGTARDVAAVVSAMAATLLLAFVLAGPIRSMPLVVDPSRAIGPSPQPSVARTAAAAGAPTPASVSMTPAQPDPPRR
jgi:hypothetical protein